MFPVSIALLPAFFPTLLSSDCLLLLLLLNFECSPQISHHVIAALILSCASRFFSRLDPLVAFVLFLQFLPMGLALVASGSRHILVPELVGILLPSLAVPAFLLDSLQRLCSFIS